ncbi:MAG: HD family hydrolase [Candidatus Hydrothermarchaeota archaeon]
MVKNVIDLIEFSVKLKNIPRSGWLKRGVSGESVAEHSFCTAFISMVLCDLIRKAGKEIDVERTLKISILHDITESLLLDLDDVSTKLIGEENKKMAELKAASQILNIFDYKNLWYEFHKNETIESKIVKCADQLELLFQALEFRKRGYSSEVLDDLWEKVELDIKEANELFILLKEIWSSRRKI